MRTATLSACKCVASLAALRLASLRVACAALMPSVARHRRPLHLARRVEVLTPPCSLAARQDFLRTTEAAFRSHPLWKNATEEELEASGEGLEKYLMTKLYARTFAVVPDDVERDRVRQRCHATPALPRSASTAVQRTALSRHRA